MSNLTDPEIYSVFSAVANKKNCVVGRTGALAGASRAKRIRRIDARSKYIPHEKFT